MSLNSPSEQKERVCLCVSEGRETRNGTRERVCVCVCMCVLACHFALESYAVVGSAECCEIYNYCGVLCYDSTGASGDSTSQRQAWETHSVCVHACVCACMCLCVQTERQHLAQNIPNPPLPPRTHAHGAWRRVHGG